MGELISFEHYLAILDHPTLLEAHSVLTHEPYLCVDLAGVDLAGVDLGRHQQQNAGLRLPICPVIGITTNASRLPIGAIVDLAVDTNQLEELIPVLKRQTLACTTLVQLLRHNEVSDITQGLLAESLSYSTLQQSEGFQRWLREARRPDSKPDEAAPVLLDWQGSTLNITLNRPAAHNAYSTNLKDALCAGLESVYAVAEADGVVIQGNGASFCAGGDLSEFGQVNDAASAHLSRTTRSAAALLSGLRCRSQVNLHGACIGAGIEIPSFADYIEAAAESFFQLPEIQMGLVPGAGGTVGICRRIGRQRTAYMAISNRRIDPATALRWGLIDKVI